MCTGSSAWGYLPIPNWSFEVLILNLFTDASNFSDRDRCSMRKWETCCQCKGDGIRKISLVTTEWSYILDRILKLNFLIPKEIEQASLLVPSFYHHHWAVLNRSLAERLCSGFQNVEFGNTKTWWRWTSKHPIVHDDDHHIWTCHHSHVLSHVWTSKKGKIIFSLLFFLKKFNPLTVYFFKTDHLDAVRLWSRRNSSKVNVSHVVTETVREFFKVVDWDN